MNRILFWLSLMLLSASNFAQTAADYTFSFSNGSYSEITGTVSTATGDDGGQNIALPFNFTYCGITYSTARISTNGFLEMGQTYTSSGNPNDLASTTTKPFLAPLWDDLVDNTASDIQYITTGTTPNRVFTVQWKGVLWHLNSGTPQNFQVRIYETTHVIEFIYGTMSTPGGSPNASIGINDHIGGTGHFISVTPGNTPTTSTTIPANYINATTYLTSGLTYTFTPPAGPAYPQSLSATAVSTSEINLTFAPNTNLDNVVIVWNQTGTFSVPTGPPPAAGEAFAGGTLLYNGTSSPQNHTGLDPYTHCFYRAFSYDGSEYSPGINARATTFCDPISSFPWSDGFEDSWPDNCWIDPETANYAWSQNVGGDPHIGTKWVYCNVAGAELQSPFFTLSADCQLRFWYRAESYAYPQDMAVKIGSTIIHQIIDCTDEDYQEAVISLASYTGQTVAITFVGETGNGGSSYGICLDDVMVKEIPNCVAISSFPWSEDFEDMGSLPDCWDQSYVSASAPWIASTGGLNGNPAMAYSGTYNGLFYSSNYNVDITMLITPELDLSSLSNPGLSFWHAQAEWSGDQDELRIYYKTSPEGSWTLIPGQEYVSSITEWTGETDIPLPDPSSTYFIGFEGTSGYGYGVCLDDITVYNISATSVFTWTGETSSDWSNTGNWDCDAVPTGTDLVVIPSSPVGGRFPVVGSGVTATCYDIHLGPGATLDVQTGGTLTVNSGNP